MKRTEVTEYGNGARPPAMLRDPFLALGMGAGQSGGFFLKFDKGEFQYGVNNTELPMGTRLAANMQGLQRGWWRWSGGVKTDEILALVTEMRPHPDRRELGDLDKALWEDPDMDPWQEIFILQLTDGGGQMYIYTAKSKGGRDAIARLSTQYGQQYRMRPGQVPIVELGGDSYQHGKYGKIHIPVFTIVDWIADEAAAAVPSAAPIPNGQDSEEAEIPFDMEEKAPAEAEAPAPQAKTAEKPRLVPDQAKQSTRAPRF